MDSHDWHHHHVGVSHNQGGLIRLERHRPQRRGERVAAMPQPAQWVEPKAPAILLGVDHEHPSGADHQMINVGAAARAGQVVQDGPAVSLQRSQGAGGAPLPHRPVTPGDGVGAGPKPQPPANRRHSQRGNDQSQPGRQQAAQDSPPTPIPRMAATRQGRVRIQVARSAARNRCQVAWAEPPGRPTVARTRIATTG